MVFPGTDLANLLESYTPSDIIKNVALLSSFRQFFQRGTRLECCELLPEGFGHPSEFTCVQDPLTPRQASVGATPQSHSPRYGRLSHEATDSRKVAITDSSDVIKVQRVLKSSEQYFKPLEIPEKRKSRLCRVAQRIAKTKTHEDYHGIRTFEFASKDSFATAKEMFQVLASQKNVVMHRIYYLYFADAVDRYEISLSDSSTGRSMKSVALDKLAEDLNVMRPNVASMYTLGCKYLTCMEAGGPGSLFSIDGAKSDMEKCNDEDFKVLFEYRKTTHPDLEERSRTLDFGVVHELVCGLRAQGVDDADIAGGRTRLIKMICQYVDTRTFLCQGKIVAKEHHGDAASPDQQGSIPFYHALKSQQPNRAMEPYKNTAKRQRVSRNEGLQTPAVCPIPMPEDNGITTQADFQHFSMNIAIFPEQQHNSAPLFEEAGNRENGRVSPTSLLATHRDLVPIPEEVEEIQDSNMTRFGLHRDEPVLSQRLSASRSGPRRSILDNADAQQPSLVNEVLPPPPISDANADFTSYAIEFVNTLDDDARLAFGLHDSLQ